MTIRRMKLFAGALVSLLALVALLGFSPVGAQEGATITGLVQVEYPAEAALPGVVVDRFEAQADGSRGSYIDSATTGDDGRYSFLVEPGSWILTFIAPDGEVWEGSGGTFVNAFVTVAAGESATVDQEIDSGIDPVVAVDDEYTFNLGEPADVDLTSNDTVIRQLGNVDYVLDSGDLPPGMSIRFPDVGGDRRSLQGTPTEAGVYNFQYQVSNERGDSDIGDVTVTVLDASPGVLAGTVTIDFPVDGPAEGVQIDLFTATADGSRGSYESSTTTAADGSYSFSVEPGVWVLTFISPSSDLTWRSNGQSWANVLVDVAAGETATNDRVLVTGVELVVAVDDEYTFTVGQDVDVDLSANDLLPGRLLSVDFVSGDIPPGMRLSFPFIGGDVQTLQGVPTTPGVYSFDYSVSTESGSDVGTVTVTVEAGELGTVSGRVTGQPPGADVIVDLFTALPDGSRDQYLRSIVVEGPSAISEGGEYSLQVDPGSYALTFITPNPESTWEATGSQWVTIPVDLSAGDFVTIDGPVLLYQPPPSPGTISGTISLGFPANALAPGVQVDLFTAQADGSRGSYVASTTTDSDGNYSFSVEPGVWVLTFISPDPENLTFESSTQIWVNVPVGVAGGETVVVDQLLVFDLVQPVDDEYTFVVGEPVVVDLAINDTVLTQVSSVEYVNGSGDLPPGMSISFDIVGGVYQELRGTPSELGTYQFQYSVSNETGASDIGNVRVEVVEAG